MFLVAGLAVPLMVLLVQETGISWARGLRLYFLTVGGIGFLTLLGMALYRAAGLEDE